MKRLLHLLDAVLAKRDPSWHVKVDPCTLHLGEDPGHTRIRCRRDGADYILSVTVLRSDEVKEDDDRWRQLAVCAWERNADQELVTFGFDNRDRLIGQIRHPADHLDPAELETYIEALALECPRFRALLKGS